MAFVLSVIAFLLLQCRLTSAGFCSEAELAGECFEDKIKPMAIAAAVAAFILGISTVMLATALLCKAKRRKMAKIMVYRQPYNKPQNVRGVHKNGGFESASKYHVKRPHATSYEEPTYVMTRNGAKPDKRVDELVQPSFAGTSQEQKRRDSPGASSAMLWVPGNGSKKMRSEPID